MGFTYSTTDSGVVLAQESVGHAEIERALKQHDRQLKLGRMVDSRFGKYVWKVFYEAGADRPDEFVCDWRDPDGTPRELSFGLVDKVVARDRNTRMKVATADELNADWEQERRKHWLREAEALEADTTFKRGRPLQHRSQKLYQQRGRERARGKKV